MFTKQDLIEYAKDEASEVAVCLWRFRKKHESCYGCSTLEFCDLLMEKLGAWEKEEAEG